MGSGLSRPRQGAIDEVSVLIEALHQAGQRLENLTGGEVDTVADRDGQTFLLRTAQDRLRQIEADKQAAILNALAQSESGLQRAQLMANLAHVITGPDGSFQRWSETLPRLIGVELHQLPRTTRAWLDLVHPDDRPLFRAKAIEAGVSKLRTEQEYRLQRADGEWIRVRQAMEPLTGENDATSGPQWFNTLQDVTEQRRGEEDNRRFGAAMDALADAVVLVDRSSMRIVHANDAACRHMDKTREQLLALDLWVWLSTSRAELERSYDVLIASGLPAAPVDTLQRRTDGSERWIEVRRHATCSEDHWIIVIIVRDITERKRIQQEILDLNVSLERRVAERTLQLEQASRAKSDFLANMSHELRTPLNSIIGFSEMMKDGVLGELDAKQRGFVTDIFDAGTHLLSLINDILDLSKVEAGMAQLESSAIDVAVLLKASTLVVREQALTHRIRLDTRIDPALGIMLADERKLKQIVYNLLSNAVKFTPDGGTVTLGAHRCARAEVALDDAMPGRLIALPPGEHDEFLAISVEDTGVGIAGAFLPKLFEPFTQVDNIIARHQHGTGLGLSLVRRLAQLHSGTVGVESSPEVGSRFSVWLPWRAAAHDALKERTTPPGTVLSEPAVPLALVIEDDDSMAELIAMQLRDEGFEVLRAASAEEGLVCAAKRRPQLITLDMILPAMDGWEFLRHLKADPQLADTPVVIMTGADGLENGAALGARRVLQKPVGRDELVAALAGLMPPRPNGEPGRVLVVDDNVTAVELVTALLEAGGYCVLRAYGGAEAISMARRELPDLVILDLMMPEVSGFEVAHALRETESTARIPILVLTAKELSAEDRARLNSDVSGILTKASFNAGQLLTELRRALPQRTGS